MQAPDINISSAGSGLDRFPASRNGSARRLNMEFFHRFIPSFLRGPLNKIFGAVQCVLVLLGVVSLATWTISDPSLTFANGRSAENWLGFWGASFSDFSMQFLGFSSAIFLAPVLVWGLFKFTARPFGRFAPRLGYWVGAMVFLSAAMGCVSVPSAGRWKLDWAELSGMRF